jgi:predicted Zn-dependent protease
MHRLIFSAFMLAALTGQADGQRPQPPRSARDFANNFDRFLGGMFGESAAERQAIENVPIKAQEERRIGEQDLANYLQSLRQQKIPIVERGRDVDYVTSLVKALRPRMRRADQYASIRVYVANSPETDARAFPGGSIVVTAGMIEFAQCEAALVGVLGHELSHIDHGHQLRMARAAELAKSGWTTGASNPQAMQQHVLLMAKSFARPFHTDDEAAADQDGAQWAYELGYEPLELARLFARLEQRGGRRQRDIQGWMPNFLRSHPPYENRQAAIRSWAAKLQLESPLKKPYVGQPNLERRIPRTVQEFPE